CKRGRDVGRAGEAAIRDSRSRRRTPRWPAHADARSQRAAHRSRDTRIDAGAPGGPARASGAPEETPTARRGSRMSPPWTDPSPAALRELSNAMATSGRVIRPLGDLFFHQQGGVRLLHGL